MRFCRFEVRNHDYFPGQLHYLFFYLTSLDQAFLPCRKLNRKMNLLVLFLRRVLKGTLSW